jgi:dephospho-CoA kinase
MDNSRDLPGYKYYVDRATGERPAVYVAYLDLAPDPQTTVNGVVFPVTDEQLAALDTRERNYERKEVVVDPPPGGPTYAYFGSTAARERFAAGPTVVARAYLALVRASFDDLGPDQAKAFAGSTDPPPVPIRDLERVDLAPT